MNRKSSVTASRIYWPRWPIDILLASSPARTGADARIEESVAIGEVCLALLPYGREFKRVFRVLTLAFPSDRVVRGPGGRLIWNARRPQGPGRSGGDRPPCDRNRSSPRGTRHVDAGRRRGALAVGESKQRVGPRARKRTLLGRGSGSVLGVLLGELARPPCELQEDPVRIEEVRSTGQTCSRSPQGSAGPGCHRGSPRR